MVQRAATVDPEPPRNVLRVTIDTLRPDALGWVGRVGRASSTT